MVALLRELHGGKSLRLAVAFSQAHPTLPLQGVVATTVCSPFDVLKSRVRPAPSADSLFANLCCKKIMNAAEGGKTAAVVVRDSFRNEGMGWLFRGWTPAFIRLGPNTVYESTP